MPAWFPAAAAVIPAAGLLILAADFVRWLLS
jgi:hypothetical protein